MKKNIIYISLAAIIGLLVGYLIFGERSDNDHNHSNVADLNEIWTCSMHPQVMKNEPGECPICGMFLTPVEGSTEGLTAIQFKMSENAMALANIQTSIVGKREMEGNTIKLSGKIHENEEANAVQVSYFSGRIENLHINFKGEQIKKGQLLATIYSPELVAAQQELLTAFSLKESQQELYKAVRNKLKLWKLTENQINQIEISGKVKENFPVYATVSGIVSEKLVEQGDYIKQGQPLFKITNLESVWALFDIYENQIPIFKKGQKITITTNAYPNKIFETQVSFIASVLNTQTRTVKVRAVLNNKNGQFKPGMFVEGNVENENNNIETSIVIQESAILWTGKESVVYIKTNADKPIFEMRKVTLGDKSGNSYQVLKGIKNGDVIVTNGTFTVDAVAQLKGKKSMMNR